MPIGEDPAAHGHWCAFTDMYHTIPYLLSLSLKDPAVSTMHCIAGRAGLDLIYS